MFIRTEAQPKQCSSTKSMQFCCLTTRRPNVTVYLQAFNFGLFISKLDHMTSQHLQYYSTNLKAIWIINVKTLFILVSIMYLSVSLSVGRSQYVFFCTAYVGVEEPMGPVLLMYCAGLLGVWAAGHLLCGVGDYAALSLEQIQEQLILVPTSFTPN